MNRRLLFWLQALNKEAPAVSPHLQAAVTFLETMQVYPVSKTHNIQNAFGRYKSYVSIACE
jgi:hypothetical protein